MIDKLADALPLWCSQLACLSVGLLIFFVAAGLLSQIGDEARRPIRPSMTDAEAAAKFKQVYADKYDHNQQETFQEMTQIAAGQGWLRNSQLPDSRGRSAPIVSTPVGPAVGETDLQRIYTDAAMGYGPNDR